MKTYYCVVTSAYDNGRVIAHLVDRITAETQPEDTFKELCNRDVYCDWFDDLEEALQTVEDAKHA